MPLKKKRESNRRGSAAFLIIVAAVMAAWTGAWAETPEVRPSVLAGTWYPRDPKELAAQVKDFLAQARPPRITGRLKAIIVPHAGYVYSGRTAAYAYALLQGQSYETVVLVGPSHRARFSGASVNLQDYQTPLGRVPVDQDLARRIIEAGGPLVGSRPEAHAREHCLEIQLPFLQTVLGPVKIAPILMGDQDLAACRNLAQTLAEVLKDRRVLLLASTDLSHFHPADQAEALDKKLIERVRAFDPVRLHQDLAAGVCEACGGGALVTVMTAAQALGADQAAVLNYTHSGRVSGDDSRVVGYLAAALLESGSAGCSAVGADLGLSREDQQRLLAIARGAIRSGLEGRKFTIPADLPPELQRPGGAFVTLKRQDRLRGCIGRITADAPLAEVVAAMAVQAAFHDPRFETLKPWELADLTLEISVLTPFEPVQDPAEIKVGLHGLMAAREGRRGLLLPQVPVEQGWSREEFLRQTCLKAGLPPTAWKEGAELYRFSAQVFGEDEVGRKP